MSHPVHKSQDQVTATASLYQLLAMHSCPAERATDGQHICTVLSSQGLFILLKGACEHAGPHCSRFKLKKGGRRIPLDLRNVR